MTRRHPARTRTKPRPDGFTLIELMAVASLVGIVVAAGSVMIAQSGAARQRAERADRLGAEADAALRAVETALRNTLRPRGDEEGAWMFAGADSTLDGRPADEVRFLTVDHRPVRPGQPESDVREVAFTLVPDGPMGMPFLRRRLDPTLTWPPDGGGVADRVAEGVIAFDVEYFDGRFWAIDWPEALGTMPTAVRVRLALADPEDPTRVVTQRRTIHLPHLPTLRRSFEAPPAEEEQEEARGVPREVQWEAPQ